MNIITFDIEEWALVKTDGQRALDRYVQYDDYLDRILEMLDACNTKATFFCTGIMAKKFPQVVRLIQDRGHDIGCHSNLHTWMNKMTEAEAREDTHAAVSALEQCIGQKVLSYRAPAFSIGESNKWMFDILVRNGIERDASVFPAARDFGGFQNFAKKEPCIIAYNGCSIKEFPICTTKVCGKELAYSGGGYFRFFPLWFIKKEMKKSPYVMCYFHIGDLLPESHGVMSKEAYEAYFKEPGTIKARYSRYIKSNLGKKKAWIKLDRLVRSDSFFSLKQADKEIDWGNTQVVRL